MSQSSSILAGMLASKEFCIRSGCSHVVHHTIQAGTQRRGWQVRCSFPVSEHTTGAHDWGEHNYVHLYSGKGIIHLLLLSFYSVSDRPCVRR